MLAKKLTLQTLEVSVPVTKNPTAVVLPFVHHPVSTGQAALIKKNQAAARKELLALKKKVGSSYSKERDFTTSGKHILI